MSQKRIKPASNEIKNLAVKEAREKANQAIKKAKDAKTMIGKLKMYTDRSMTRKEKAANRSIINSLVQDIKTNNQTARQAQLLAKKKPIAPNFFRKAHHTSKNAESKPMVKSRKK